MKQNVYLIDIHKGRTLQLNIPLAGSKTNFEIMNPHFHKNFWLSLDKNPVKNQDSKFLKWLLDPVSKIENGNVQNQIFHEFPIQGIWFSSD